LPQRATQSRRKPDGIGFTLRLTPKGGRDAVDGWGRDANGALVLKARVSAPPEDGKANAALVSLLATVFAVPRSAVTITAGASARTKRIQIGGDRQTLSARLNQFGDAK
jgi:uncharacterized protein (TIGR00251 family)